MKKQNILYFCSIIFLCLALAACTPQEQQGTNDQQNQQEDHNQHNQQDQTGGEQTDHQDQEAGIPAKERPATKTDTITLEGMPEEFTFTLYVDESLQFSTYVPNDIIAESASSGEGDVAHFYANFANQKNPDARLSIFSPTNNAGMNKEEQINQLLEEMKQSGYELSERTEGNRLELSEKELGLRYKNEDGTSIIGIVSFFSHGDRLYQLIMQYPEEYSEGFGPRAVKIIHEIMWFDEK